MFDLNILNLASADKQREAVTAGVTAAVEAGTFTYTELWGSKEPLRTMGHEALDGVGVKGNIAQYNQHPIVDWDGRGLILVSLTPGGSVKGLMRRRVKVPGTTITKTEEFTKDFGNFASIPDSYPERTARNILHHDGWPAIDNRSGGSHNGTVVEWRWLKKEALSASPSDGAREIYEEILTRPGFAEFLKKHEDSPEVFTPQNTSKKAPGAQRQVGATP